MWLYGLSSFIFSFTKTQGAGRGAVVGALYVMYVFWACSFPRSYRFFSSTPILFPPLLNNQYFLIGHFRIAPRLLFQSDAKCNAIDLKTILFFYSTKTFFRNKGLDFALFSKREFVELGNDQYCILVRNVNEEPLQGCPSTSIISYSYSFWVKTLT